MAGAKRDDVHRRFLEIVERGVARADRERADHLARIKALPRVPSEGRARIDQLFRPTKKKPEDA